MKRSYMKIIIVLGILKLKGYFHGNATWLLLVLCTDMNITVMEHFCTAATYLNFG